MKYLSVLVAIFAIFLAGSSNAQSSTNSGSKSYTYVMKNIDGTGGEIIDKLTITGNTLTTERLTASGFSSGKMVQKASANGKSEFEAILKSDSNGSMKFNVSVSDKTVDGTVLVVDKQGVQTTMAVRGLSTEEWDNIQKAKKEYKETQTK